MSHSLELYKNKILSSFKNDGIENVHMIPKITKINISMGLGSDGSDKKLLDGAITELMLITGRKPVVTKSKISIAAFKLRENQNIGAYVTLRGKIMYEFLDRLIYISLPKVHDFKGFKFSSIDDCFNFSCGIKDHLVFPELSYDKIIKQRGLNIAMTVKSSSKEDTYKLLKLFNFPIKK